MRILIIAVCVLLTACGTADNEQTEKNNETNNESGNNVNDQEEKEETMEEELAYHTEASLEDGLLTVRLELVNETAERKQLTFRSGQRYNVVIHDAEGNKQFDYAEGMMFTQAIEEEELESGESLSYELEWEAEGEGPYEVTAEITVSEIDDDEADRSLLQETVSVE
jgi:hypothetical protein